MNSSDDWDADKTNCKKHGLVGYKRPPVDKQFKPGQSGNPKGRPKGRENIATILRRKLLKQVTVRDGYRTRTDLKIAVAIEVILNKALNGNDRALWKLIEAAEKFKILDLWPEDRRDAEAESAAKFIRERLAELRARRLSQYNERDEPHNSTPTLSKKS